MAHYSSVEQIDSEQALTCKASELSRVSGVKKQVLRRYDRIGLLHPQVKFDSGWHLYTRRDLIQLERLAMMQMLGLSRSDMKDRLSSDDRNLIKELRLQREILIEKRRRMNHVIYFLEYAEEINRDPHSDDWHYLARVVEAIQALKDPEYFKRSYIQGYMHEESGDKNRPALRQRSRLLEERD